MANQPERLEIVGDFLAVKWTDGSESVVGLNALRTHCPCAQCAGEPDITGAIRIPANPTPLSEKSFELQEVERVGNYAIAFTWGDGHRTGIYSWEIIQRIAAMDES